MYLRAAFFRRSAACIRGIYQPKADALGYILSPLCGFVRAAAPIVISRYLPSYLIQGGAHDPIPRFERY
jgi:hypothetical protein